MLLLGNSLLLEGVDFPSLRGTMIPRYDVHRLVIEQTDYLDLYYILRTLFRNGSRPHDLVLCLSVGQLMADDTRGEFTARYVDAAGVADLAHREHFDATTMTNYMFAHWSGWFGTRAEIRKWLLGRMMPDIGALDHRSWVPHGSALIRVRSATGRRTSTERVEVAVRSIRQPPNSPDTTIPRR